VDPEPAHVIFADIGDILSLINIFMGVTLAVLDWHYYRTVKRDPARWIKLMHMAIGIYWAGIYTILLLVPNDLVPSTWFGQIWLRPAITITLGILAASAVIRNQAKK
jgi:hypothetical protein